MSIPRKLPRRVELVPAEEFEKAIEERNQWKKAYEELQQLHTLKNTEYNFELQWLRDLHTHGWLSGDHKLVLWEIRCVLKRLRFDLAEPMHIWLGELVNRTGLSDSTIKKLTNELAEVGLITKETRGKGKGQKTWFSLNENIRVSAKIMPIHAPKRNHGGDRLRCTNCHSENIEPVVYKCRDCKHQWHL